MKAVGIVAEYNPFHSGHRYQIRKIREIFGAETPVAAVMSGDFVQRGEAASYDKFTRAEAAVRGGVSLVIELPLPWSLSSAESFARGGVGLLGAAGVIDALSFGSESGDLSALEKTAAVLDTPEFAEALKRELTGGTPFAAARARRCSIRRTIFWPWNTSARRRSSAIYLIILPSGAKARPTTARAARPSSARFFARGRALPGVSPGRCGRSFAVRMRPDAALSLRRVCERRISPGCGRKRRRTLPPCRTLRKDCIFGFTKLRAAEAPRKRSPILPNQSGTPTRGCAVW